MTKGENMENDLISRSNLARIIEEDMRELRSHHKDSRGRIIHDGEYRHFLKRIYEQNAMKVVAEIREEK